MKSLAALLLPLSLVALAGCSETHAVIANVQQLCGKPPLRAHTVSKDDKLTEATAKQLEEDNAALPTLCPPVATINASASSISRSQ